MIDYKNDEMNIPTFLENAKIEYVWAYFPRMCYITNKLIWFNKAYRVSTELREGWDYYIARRWFTKEAYIKYLLSQ